MGAGFAVLAALAIDGAAVPLEEMPPARSTYFVALYEPGPAWVQGRPPFEQAGVREHGAYMDELSRKGKLPLGGPLMGNVERMELSGALLVIDAGSQEEARSLVLADPALEADIMRLAELRHFLVYIGGIAERIREAD